MSTPVVRFRLDFGRDEAVGPGKITLLEHIGRGGSLSQAARDLKMSYRRAWQLLESVNGSFRERAVVTQKGGRGGGGASLTPFGLELIKRYRAFDAQVQSLAARSFRPLSAKAHQGARRRARAAPVRRLSGR
jgi:molybdate transport system regulatory protein